MGNIAVIRLLVDSEDSSSPELHDICKICHCEKCDVDVPDNMKKLITPCACKTPVHRQCLNSWLQTRTPILRSRCEICRKLYNPNILMLEDLEIIYPPLIENNLFDRTLKYIFPLTIILDIIFDSFKNLGIKIIIIPHLYLTMRWCINPLFNPLSLIRDFLILFMLQFLVISVLNIIMVLVITIYNILELCKINRIVLNIYRYLSTSVSNLWQRISTTASNKWQSISETASNKWQAYQKRHLISGKAYQKRLLICGKEYQQLHLISGKAYQKRLLICGKAYQN